MAHREFTDSSGLTWQVWEVEPSRPERRVGPPDRRRVPRGPDRRQQPPPEPRVRLSRPEYAQGWLAFEARHEKRRLAPVPDGWETLDDAGLERLLQSARSVGIPRRLLE